jgi:hypothetical protein
MQTSFIKKIVTVAEWTLVAKDISELFEEDNKKYGHACELTHDYELITKCLSHESLLLWNMHVWAHFNGEKWDGIFIGSIRKSEKFNKKVMDEYLWLSKNSGKGIRLFNIAKKFAKDQGCQFIIMNVVENHPASIKLKNFYKRLGFKKDCETHILPF